MFNHLTETQFITDSQVAYNTKYTIQFIFHHVIQVYIQIFS